MSKTEVYLYSRSELEENKVIVSENKINDTIYITEKAICNIYLANDNKPIGIINYENNVVLSKITAFNTSVGTIITDKGSLVFNLNYTIRYNDSKPDENLLLVTSPTFTSGDYLLYKNIKISIQILKLTGERIVSIEYN